MPLTNRSIRNKWPTVIAAVWLLANCALSWAGNGHEPDPVISDIQKFLTTHCLDCHTGEDAELGFRLDNMDGDETDFQASDFDSARWEKILRRVATRQMPPPDSDRPDELDYRKFETSLSNQLAMAAGSELRVGSVGSIRRLTRMEYQNAIRDLLGIQINASEFLPKDESSNGFDNITVEELSPVLIQRYLSAAQKISRLAVGSSGNGPLGVTIRIPADRSQEEHVQGLPFGTRGGLQLTHTFPQSGDYEFEIKLTRDRDEKVEGLNRRYQIHVLVDRKLSHEFTVQPPTNGTWENRDFTHVDSHLKVRLPIQSGNHEIAITFPKLFSSLVEDKRQPFDTNYNRHRHPRKTPAIFQVSILGPFDSNGGNTSNPRIFGSVPLSSPRNRDTAKRILEKLTTRAYRRPATARDLATPMKFFDSVFEQKGFDQAIESALASILVNPNFILKIESEGNAQPGARYRELDSFELASRLSFFIWSSIPDNQLLEIAEQGILNQESVLREQVQRMLADPRSKALATNFASQWLYLRNLDSITPDLRLFPDFDDNLRQSFRQETEMLFEHVVQEDRSILDLIQSDFTFLNSRLATHYDIQGISGSEFQKVHLPGNSRRGGILRHGSILTVTSYATRTSPTIRGNWVLENIIGTPPPPPPPNIPNLKENTQQDSSTVRQRLAAHRANPACAACHDLIDPIGFSLENYDAVGRWRQFDGTLDLETGGVLPDGTKADSVAAL
ncbi:MAG: DUF1592 domain-containing protein [Planctomycetota bacterium]